MPKFNTAQLYLEFLEHSARRLPLVTAGLVGVALVCVAISFGLQIKQNWWFHLPSDIGDFQTQARSLNRQTVLGASDNCVLLGLRNSMVVCLSPRTGKLRWQTWLTEPTSEPPKTVIDSTTLIFSTDHGGFQAISTVNGQSLWKFQHPAGYHWQLWNLSKNEQEIIALDRHNTLFVIEVATGKVRWSQTVPSQKSQTISAENQMEQFFTPLSNWQADDHTIFWGNFETGELTAWDKQTGLFQWRRADFFRSSTGDFWVDHGQVWYRTHFDELITVDVNNGQQLAKISLPSQTFFTVTGKNILTFDFSQTIKWYDQTTGEYQQTTNLPHKVKKLWFESNQLFVQLATSPFQDTVASLNSETGQLIWQSTNLGIINQIQLLPNQTLVVAGANGQVTWLDAKTGAILHAVALVGEPSFLATDPTQPDQLWVLSTHPASVGTESLVDVTFFDQPGHITTQWQDLAMDPTTAFLYRHRLWLVGQDHTQLISLLSKPFWPQWFTWRQPTPQPVTVKPLLIQSIPATTNFSATVNQLSSTCLATFTATLPTPQPGDQLLAANFNPWTDVQLKVHLSSLASSSGAPVIPPTPATMTITGYYSHDWIWQAVAALPTAGTWNWTATLSGPGWSQTIQGTLTAAPESQTCSWDFLQINKDHQLVTQNQKPFWAIGLQDVIVDLNDDGNIFDQWILGQSPQPPATTQLINPVPFETYLETYSQAGFGLYRLSLDNFSFKLWNQLDPTTFQGSVVNGQRAETFLRTLKAKKYRVMFAVFGFEPIKDSTAIQPYLDYVINRFSPYVDIWELSNEAWLDEIWVTWAADYLKTHDPYRHPVTVNWDRANLANIDVSSLHYYRSEPWAELANEFLFQLTTAQRWQKPVLFSEIGNSDKNWDADSADRFRVKMWLSDWFKAPLIFWNYSRYLSQGAENANLYLGPIERQFVTHHQTWLKKYADLTLIGVPTPESIPNSTNCYGQTNRRNLLLLYCVNPAHTFTSSSIPIATWLEAAQLPALTTKKWQVSWFDPATGKKLASQQVDQPTIFTRAFTTDIVSEWKIVD